MNDDTADEPLPARSSAEADFPYDRVEAQHVTRRELAKYLVVVSGGLTAGTGWVAVKATLPSSPLVEHDVKLCTLDELPVGAMRPFVIPESGEPAILVRPAELVIRAFEQKCTHLSCAVFFSPESGRIECPCHRGAFDAESGAVIEGPPPRPLHSFALEIRDGAIWLLREQRS